MSRKRRLPWIITRFIALKDYLKTRLLLSLTNAVGAGRMRQATRELVKAHKTIKNMEKQGKERSEICEMLKEKFGEKNPDVKV